MRTAVIMTCHNRCELTRQCLRSLYEVWPDVDVFLTDDGSTDGTVAMLENDFPKVHIIQGDGTLFWNRGMHRAWTEALKKDFDFYLWLNDDSILLPNIKEELFATYQQQGQGCIVSGLVSDEYSKLVIYGGSDASGKLVGHSGKPEVIIRMNGNVVLVPRQVVEQIGILDPVYHHDLGDVDYGLRARENGIGVWSTGRVVAKGRVNKVVRIRKWGASLRHRMKVLHSPLGCPPRQNFYFRRRHFGLLKAIAFVLYVYVINIMPDTIVRWVWKNKYVL